MALSLVYHTHSQTQNVDRIWNDDDKSILGTNIPIKEIDHTYITSTKSINERQTPPSLFPYI